MTIRDLTVRAVDVPLRRQLGTSGGAILSAPLLLLDMRTTDGVVGRAYVFCFDALGGRLLRETLLAAAELVADQPLDAAAIEARLDRRFRLVGARGLIGMALAGVDIAVWDALAQAAGQPLARYLGAEPVAVPAYNSNGLGIMGDRAVALDAEELVAEGFHAIKLRLGYESIERDLNALRWVRTAVGGDVEVLVDYNQLLAPGEARDRCAALDAHGVGWIEEPIAHDDFAACAQLAAATATPIQIGENFMGPHVVRQALDAEASDLVMFDLQRIGGVSGWLRAARITAAAGIPTSSHLFPEVSVHLLAATPTRDRLEFVDWANPILAEPLVVRDGLAVPREVPGTGVVWDETAVARYLT